MYEVVRESFKDYGIPDAVEVVAPCIAFRMKVHHGEIVRYKGKPMLSGCNIVVSGEKKVLSLTVRDLGITVNLDPRDVREALAAGGLIGSAYDRELSP